MASMRIDVGLFDGRGDFGSWKKKMRALLSHYKVHWALEPDETKWPENKELDKDYIKEEAYNLIFLHLSDSVIREVDGIDTALQLWEVAPVFHPEVGKLDMHTDVKGYSLFTLPLSQQGIMGLVQKKWAALASLSLEA